MHVNARTSVQFLWSNAKIDRAFRAGVSLHSHTQLSEEGLPAFAGFFGYAPFWRYLLGGGIDYGRVFYSPAVTPRQGYRLEEKQIEGRLQLSALVSLTDHDKIEANKLLHLIERFRHAPISTEWTVPYGSTFFHIGVHNLAPAIADEAMERLLAYTVRPDTDGLTDVLAGLTEDARVMVVVNHPLWDEKGIGSRKHRHILLQLLQQCGEFVHALEVNGLRSFPENEEVLRMGTELNLPVVAGGDRHGREPNAVLNLSRAKTFTDFVHEVRRDRLSHVVFMPQYRSSRAVRIARIAVDALREYPEHVHLRRTWKQRVLYRPVAGAEPIPLCSAFPGGCVPPAFRMIEGAVKLARTGAVRSIVRVALPGSVRF